MRPLTSDPPLPNLRVSGVEYDEPVGKIFKLDKDGKLAEDRAGRPKRGRAICREISFKEYADWRQALGSGTILAPAASRPVRARHRTDRNYAPSNRRF